MGTCSLPACVEGVKADVVISTFKCITNFCYGEVNSWADWYSRQLVLVPQSDIPLDHALVGIVPKLAQTLDYGSVAGWRVLVTPDELVITAELIFGAATAVSAAIDLAGAGSAAASGAGLPYYVTMPASEVFAFTAEALLIAAICRPVVTAKQAVLLSVLANSASLLLGLVLL